MIYFDYVDSILHAESVSLSEISKAVGTPFYVYSASAIKDNYQNINSALEGLNHSISYAVKANSNVAILKLLANLGAGMDIVSSGEYLRAKSAGVSGDKIVFSGVGKTKEEMAIAIEGGIKQFNVESEPELLALNSVAASFGKIVPISVRVNPDINAFTHEKISTGKSENKFGIPYGATPDFCEIASQFSNLKVTGIAVHIGSQLTDLEPYRKTFIKIAELVKILRSSGHKISGLDLGGGIGISYRDNMKVINIKEYADLIKNILGHLDCELEFEPGRFIVGNAGLLICSTIYVKRGAGRQFLILDGAMNDLVRPSMYDAYHDIIPVKEQKLGMNIKFDVVGPICETGDTFAKDRNLKVMSEGDLLAICSSGAYGAVMASEYNSRPLVPEVLVKGSKFSVIRPRPSMISIIDKDIIPEWLY